MKYINKFKLYEDFDSEYYEEWEDDVLDDDAMEVNFEKMNKTISTYSKNGMAIKVFKSDWPLFLEFLKSSDIRWKGGRNPEIDDINVTKYSNNHIVVYVRKYEKSIGGRHYRMSFFKSEDAFWDSNEETLWKFFPDELKIKVYREP